MNSKKKISKKIILTLLVTLIINIQLACNQTCAFCNPSILQTHTFYEDDCVRGMCTHKPVQPGHCLVVVKRHIERFDEINDKECLAIGQLIKKINTATQNIQGPSSYIILQKNGTEVGQSVPHVHVHYIPKKVTSNPFAVIAFWFNYITVELFPALSQEQLALNVSTLRNAVQ